MIPTQGINIGNEANAESQKKVVINERLTLTSGRSSR